MEYKQHKGFKQNSSLDKQWHYPIGKISSILREDHKISRVLAEDIAEKMGVSIETLLGPEKEMQTSPIEPTSLENISSEERFAQQEQRCLACRWYDRESFVDDYGAEDQDYEGWGYCRQQPPVACWTTGHTYNYPEEGQWPITLPFYWCGAWETKETSK